jgi:SAM-dependent methyltransferase
MTETPAPAADVEPARFAFGENWTRFLAVINDQRIARAEASLTEMLQQSSLTGKTFLDIGSGSGIFSLAARRLGARVTSFDLDRQSVRCTEELRRRYFPADDHWQVLRGSALDPAFLRSLGPFDMVYSWGVLHHTGDMWTAIANVSASVAPRGQLYIAIYNDQGLASRVWTQIKRIYNKTPKYLRFLILLPCYFLIRGWSMIVDIRSGHPLQSWQERTRLRGMSPWRDMVDWVGGYPFEVATREKIIDFLRQRGFGLRKLISCGNSSGCNQFLFDRREGAAS